MSEQINQAQIRQKRLEKDESFETTYKRTEEGLVIRVTAPSESAPVIFDLYLEGGFPFHAPRLVCETVLCFPSVADGRNLIHSCLTKKWGPSITSVNIIQSLPRLIEEMDSNPIGIFELGQDYPFSVWANKSGMQVFMCEEIDIKHPKRTREKAFVVTHTCVLQLETYKEKMEYGHLTSWATLLSINSMEIDELFTIEWKDIDSSGPYKQVFNMQDAQKCSDLIRENTSILMDPPSRPKKAGVIPEEEVSLVHIQDIDIAQIMQELEEAESKLHDLATIDNLNNTLYFYQRAVEYFSAIGDSQSQELLEKMHFILSNEKILTILQKEDDKKKIMRTNLEVIKEETEEF